LWGGKYSFCYSKARIDQSACGAQSISHVETDKLKVLAITVNKRSSLAPDLPTMAEASALQRYDSAIWYGLLAPAGTPRDIIDRISHAVNDAKRLTTDCP
jgi:tripartite-type tricarboxylate transporter receptor subunit TctC